MRVDYMAYLCERLKYEFLILCFEFANQDSIVYICKLQFVKAYQWMEKFI